MNAGFIRKIGYLSSFTVGIQYLGRRFIFRGNVDNIPGKITFIGKGVKTYRVTCKDKKITNERFAQPVTVFLSDIVA